MEAAPGFEPGDGGSANLCLTVWLCRLVRAENVIGNLDFNLVRLFFDLISPDST